MTQTGDSCCMEVGALSAHVHTAHACQRKNMTRQTFCAAGSVPATPPVSKTDGFFFLEELARFQVCSSRRGATRKNHYLSGTRLDQSRARLWPRVVCPRFWRTMPAEFCAYAGARLSGVKPGAQRLCPLNPFDANSGGASPGAGARVGAPSGGHRRACREWRPDLSGPCVCTSWSTTFAGRTAAVLQL